MIIGVTTAILQVYGAFRFGIADESDFGIFQGERGAISRRRANVLAGVVRLYSARISRAAATACAPGSGLGYVIWTALNVAIACIVFISCCAPCPEPGRSAT
jgi:hypothetical protein